MSDTTDSTGAGARLADHTPGPWAWAHNSASSDQVHCLTITSPERDSEVAYCQSYTHLDYDDRTETIANAHLIAAAPTMLIDLRAALAVCDRIVRDYGAVECGVDFSALQTRLRATIATATAAESHARALLAASEVKP